MTQKDFKNWSSLLCAKSKEQNQIRKWKGWLAIKDDYTWFGDLVRINRINQLIKNR